MVVYRSTASLRNDFLIISRVTMPTYLDHRLLDFKKLQTLSQQQDQGMSLDMLRKRESLGIQDPVTLQFDGSLTVTYRSHLELITVCCTVCNCRIPR